MLRHFVRGLSTSLRAVPRTTPYFAFSTSLHSCPPFSPSHSVCSFHSSPATCLSAPSDSNGDDDGDSRWSLDQLLQRLSSYLGDEDGDGGEESVVVVVDGDDDEVSSSETHTLPRISTSNDHDSRVVVSDDSSSSSSSSSDSTSSEYQSSSPGAGGSVRVLPTRYPLPHTQTTTLTFRTESLVDQNHLNVLESARTSSEVVGLFYSRRFSRFDDEDDLGGASDGSGSSGGMSDELWRIPTRVRHVSRVGVGARVGEIEYYEGIALVEMEPLGRIVMDDSVHAFESLPGPVDVAPFQNLWPEMVRWENTNEDEGGLDVGWVTTEDLDIDIEMDIVEGDAVTVIPEIGDDGLFRDDDDDDDDTDLYGSEFLDGEALLDIYALELRKVLEELELYEQSYRFQASLVEFLDDLDKAHSEIGVAGSSVVEDGRRSHLDSWTRKWVEDIGIDEVHSRWREFLDRLIDGSSFLMLTLTPTSDRVLSSELVQTVYSEPDVVVRIVSLVKELKRHLDVVHVQRKIQEELDHKLAEQHRKYYLQEQHRIIGDELGLSKSEKKVLQDKYDALLDGKELPEEVQVVVDEEMSKLMSLEPHSAEYGVCRNYLDWLCALPWGVISEDNRDILLAEEALNSQHYGLEDLKERILEFIAVGILKDSVRGKILCFVGPPGTGKTSIGASIAEALGRDFFRFSVGGMDDVSEVKGHRRTYIGAMPGKPVQVLKRSATSNPVILIDEIDKIGLSHRGDPASALLEVLDPEQNSSFLDHYLDVPLDLSKVLFICTANQTGTIPRPLLDRMEVLSLSGYVMEEKVEIAKQYLLPRLLDETGLEPDAIEISDEILREVVKGYCREAGVRSLEKELQKILRKVAFETVREGKTHHVIDEEVLAAYLGKPKYTSARIYDELPIGTTVGLAWNELGGSILYVETMAEDASEKARHSVRATGSLGDVIGESIEIAHTVARKILSRIDPENDFFRTHQIHLHMPEGGISKDGPSAGITFVTSLLSLALNKRCKEDLGMTGEITLSGKVLPIGGVKEKVVAAKRARLKEIILPRENSRDLDELSEPLKKGLVFHFVDYYEDVFDLVFETEESD